MLAHLKTSLSCVRAVGSQYRSVAAKSFSCNISFSGLGWKELKLRWTNQVISIKKILYANSNFDLKTPAWMDASPEEVHLVTGSRMTDG